MAPKNFSQLCAALADAELQHRVLPTEAGRTAALFAIEAVQAAFDAAVIQAPEPTPHDRLFIQLCNAQLHSYAAWRADASPRNKTKMHEAVAALQAFMRPRVAG